MRTKQVLKILLVVMTVIAITSCQSREESAISDLRELSERIETESDSFSDEDWEDVSDEYACIEEEASGCEFSAEQRREWRRLKSKIYSAFGKEGAKNLIEGVGTFLRDAKDYMEGAVEGVQESYDDGELHDLAEEFKDGVEDLTDEISEELEKYQD